MKVLVADSEACEATRVADALRSAGHDVQVSGLESRSLFSLGPHMPQFAVVGVTGEGAAAFEFLRKLRLLAGLRPLYLMAAFGETTDEQRSRAYLAGVDGELPRGSSAGHLVAAIRASQRLVTALEKLAPPIESTRPPADQNAIDAIGWSGAFRTAAADIRTVASTFFNTEATLASEGPERQPPGLATAIFLLSTERQAELRIALGADITSARVLADELFGPGSRSLVPDMLSELANNFMGALKTSLSLEGFAFTGGLPLALAPELLTRPESSYKYQSTFTLCVGDSRITTQLGLRSKAHLMVEKASLREGMVVANDLTDAKGLLLLPRNTRLSKHMIDRLANMLQASKLIEVMAA